MKQSKISPDHESMNLRFKISSNMFEPFTYNPKIGWSMMVVVIIPVLSRINTIPHLLADAPSVAVSMVLSASHSSIPEDLLGGKCVEIYGSSIIFHPVSRRKTNLWVTAFRQYTQHVHTRACIVIYLHNYMSVCMCVFYQCIITYTSAYALFISRARMKNIKIKVLHNYIWLYDWERIYSPFDRRGSTRSGTGLRGFWNFWKLELFQCLPRATSALWWLCCPQLRFLDLEWCSERWKKLLDDQLQIIIIKSLNAHHTI